MVKINFKKNFWFALILIGVFVIAIYFMIPKQVDCKTASVKDMNILHENLALHIHPQLTIILDGEKQSLPANIGVTGNIMRPIHTHDSTGVLHVEAPCQREFRLGEFFEVWGKTFSTTCILDKCDGRITMTVNGVENTLFENYLMNDNDNITITYTSK